MITVSEIKKKSENLYAEYLKSIISGEDFFPKILRSNKSVSSDFNEMRKELSEIIECSKDRKGFGYAINYKQINTRQHGVQSLPEEISFQTEIDFLKYLNKEKEVRFFREDLELILQQFPQLQDWISKYPSKVINNHTCWRDLLKVCHCFVETPKPNLYIRELPIKVHTKFIEQNKSILKELLDVLIKEHCAENETDFEKRFNLKCVEPLIRFKVLDNVLSQEYFSGINDLSIQVSQFERLNLPIENVLIVENKTNLLTIALTLPELKNTIVVFGSGYKIENLKKVEWFQTKKLFYWGDLDVHGFEILSQFRGYFPHTESFLMDENSFNRYFENDNGTPSKVATPLNLTPKEQESYNLLKTNNWRLEQEKIPTKYVTDVIYRLINTKNN